MRKVLARVAVLSVVAAGLAVGSPAHAGPVPPGVAEGRRCTFSSVSDPAGEEEAFVGQINAGPLAATAAGAGIQITCTIQVGGANSTHAGEDADSVTSTAGTQVASIPPTDDDLPPVVNYVAPENTPVFLCTEAIINGQSWFWDATIAEEGPVDQLDTATGWTTSSGALCNEAIRQEIFPGPFQPVLDLIDSVLATVDAITQPFEEAIDGLICGVLGGLAPGIPGVLDITGEGDVYLFGLGLWDCPTYGNLNDRFIDLIPITVTVGPAGTPQGPNCTGNTCTVDAPVNCYYATVDVVAGGAGTVTGTASCAPLVATASATGPNGTGHGAAWGIGATPLTCTKAVTGNPEPATVTCTFWVSPF
jgi:hypothetical protein